MVKVKYLITIFLCLALTGCQQWQTQEEIRSSWDAQDQTHQYRHQLTKQFNKYIDQSARAGRDNVDIYLNNNELIHLQYMIQQLKSAGYDVEVYRSRIDARLHISWQYRNER